jgi:ribosome biogenesis GTPase A
MLWPKIAHPTDGLMLAASHAVGVNALIEEEVATFLAEIVLQRYPQFLTERYGMVTEGIDAVSVIEGVAKKRGYRLKGGDWDYEKAAHTLLLDYRSGALGRVSLESPQSRELLLASYVPPVLLGLGKSVDTGIVAEEADIEPDEE